ncbi:MAG: N-6 DNA methylase [Lentimicrobiaceae bacterium]|nr:N-6 DNA methylase [Lentimicrobiaceae bacterium]
MSEDTNKVKEPGIDYETQAVIPDGKISDYITGQWVKESEQEKVRQNFERTLTEEYNYNKEDIRIDIKIKVWDGSKQRTKKVPLAVMKAVTEEPYILILVVNPKTEPAAKKNGTDELEQWLVDVKSAEFGCWTNGIETLYFQKKKEKLETDVFPVNDFPRKGEDASSIYTTDRRRLRVATGNNLLYAFKRCHDYIHANQGGSKEQIFWEFLKILFAKIEDETQNGRPKFAIRNAEERNESSGRKGVKDRIETLFREVKQRREYAGLFDDQAPGILFNPETVSYIVSQLEKYDFIHSSVDVKGVAYETIVGPTLEGTKGEFFTPRNVVKMTVKMLDPEPGARIYDPACGTGGFIVIAFNYISEKLRQKHKATWANPNKPSEAEEKALFEEIHEAGKNIFGTDFNSNLVKAAQMNMIMNNDGRGGLFAVNSLKPVNQWPKAVQEKIQLSSMDYVMANPPFGAKIKIDSAEILERYDLAHAWSKTSDDKWQMETNLKNAMEPEVLFVERCVSFLKPGTGQLGIVLPDSILSNPGYAYVRYWILQNCQVLASVDLPVETFLPRTGTQTSVLILRRKSENEKLMESMSGEMAPYKTFMANVKKVGKDRRGNFIYKKDERGREIVKRSLYKPFVESTILDFLPTVETTGRIVDDELPGVAKNYLEIKKSLQK